MHWLLTPALIYSAMQVVFSSRCRDSSRVSIRIQSESFTTSLNWIGGSMLRPVDGSPCMLLGGLLSMIRILLSVNALSASNTSVCKASLTACCRAARLASVGLVMRAGTSSALAMVWHPARTINAANVSFEDLFIAEGLLSGSYARATSEQCHRLPQGVDRVCQVIPVQRLQE